jgi:hypothetical protein
MKRALVLFAVLLLLFTPPAFGGVPELNIKAICKARSADAKMLQKSVAMDWPVMKTRPLSASTRS